MTRTETEQTITRYYTQLVAHGEASLVRLGLDKDQAMDFVHDLMVQMLESPELLDAGKNPLAWLKTRLGWLIQDYAKRERKFRKVELETLDNEGFLHPDPDLELQYKEVLEDDDPIV